MGIVVISAFFIGLMAVIRNSFVRGKASSSHDKQCLLVLLNVVRL